MTTLQLHIALISAQFLPHSQEFIEVANLNTVHRSCKSTEKLHAWGKCFAIIFTCLEGLQWNLSAFHCPATAFTFHVVFLSITYHLLTCNSCSCLKHIAQPS